MDIISFQIFLPEIFLSFCILFQLIFNVTLLNNSYNNFPILNLELLSQIFFILFCLLVLLLNSYFEGYSQGLLFIQNLNSYLLKIIFIIFCLLSILVIWRSFLLNSLNFFEFFTFFFLCILSILLLFSVNDMLSSYLILELQTLAFYILASFNRNSCYSIEAGLKYFITGSFVSILFLFGCAIIYGLIGTLNFTNLKLIFIFSFNSSNLFFFSLLTISILLIIVSLLFKLGIFPFHFWVADVYDGSPNSATIIFAIIPKLAVTTLLIKCLLILCTNFSIINFFLLILGILSSFIGSVYAIKQKRFKRFLIFSSIAQFGYVIIGISVNTLTSFFAVYFFIFIYLITSVLLWFFFTMVFNSSTRLSYFNSQIENFIYLTDFFNFYKNNLFFGIYFIFIFFSLSGIPLFAGFYSKLFIIFAMLEVSNIFNTLILVMISTISVYYYLRLLKIFFFETKNNYSKPKFSQANFNPIYFKLDCYINSFFLYLLVFIFFYPSFLILFSEKIVINLGIF